MFGLFFFVVMGYFDNVFVYGWWKGWFMRFEFVGL